MSQKYHNKNKSEHSRKLASTFHIQDSFTVHVHLSNQITHKCMVWLLSFSYNHSWPIRQWNEAPQFHFHGNPLPPWPNYRICSGTTVVFRHKHVLLFLLLNYSLHCPIIFNNVQRMNVYSNCTVHQMIFNKETSNSPTKPFGPVTL